MDNEQKLANLSMEAKAQLYDQQINLQKDENGQTLFNAGNLADYQAMFAQNEQQYQNYAQTATNAEQMNLQAMNYAYQQVSQDLTNKYQTAKQAGDNAQAEQLAQQKYAADVSMQQLQARAANNQSMISAGMSALSGGGMAAAILLA
jgi:hypothetical protein